MGAKRGQTPKNLHLLSHWRSLENCQEFTLAFPLAQRLKGCTKAVRTKTVHAPK